MIFLLEAQFGIAIVSEIKLYYNYISNLLNRKKLQTIIKEGSERMKKFIIAIICFLTLTACNNETSNNSTNTDYIAKDGHCIVTIPNDYRLIYEDEKQGSMQDIDLVNAETVEGKPKSDELEYFSVLVNEPFRILTPFTVIQNKNKDHLTLTAWKINGENYKDSDSYLSKNTYTCSENTIIEPVYSEFKTVGLILFHIDSEKNPTTNLFDEDGKIIEQEDVKYLYGPYEFDSSKESWNTNMELESFETSYTVKDEKRLYKISIRYDLTETLKKGRVAVKSISQIKDQGYMINPKSDTKIISVSDMVMVGGVTYESILDDYVLEYTFTINM